MLTAVGYVKCFGRYHPHPAMYQEEVFIRTTQENELSHSANNLLYIDHKQRQQQPNNNNNSFDSEYESVSEESEDPRDDSLLVKQGYVIKQYSRSIEYPVPGDESPQKDSAVEKNTEEKAEEKAEEADKNASAVNDLLLYESDSSIEEENFSEEKKLVEEVVKAAVEKEVKEKEKKQEKEQEQDQEQDQEKEKEKIAEMEYGGFSRPSCGGCALSEEEQRPNPEVPRPQQPVYQQPVQQPTQQPNNVQPQGLSIEVIHL
ncbi:hypothetical protein NEFER03_0833 [Nematocida sp. LUAm3]|nr:hypothetical protein NEFER03_0833 [Nematocida sp. LUAm3]KAI5174851.1 hypothetical protein NEFER02_0951 [Nematocida sp. LUAm2]KAI5177551.1 hypothetical protein NEFER01_0801 [Nematocida sp. LUAm1]